MKMAMWCSTVTSAIAIGWLCWMSSTVVAHGQSLASLEARAQSFNEADKEVKAALLRIEEDIKKLLERR